MSLKEKIENNVVLWMLGMLLTGFLAGIGTYKSILEIAHLTVVADTSDAASVERELDDLRAENERLRATDAAPVASTAATVPPRLQSIGAQPASSTRSDQSSGISDNSRSPRLPRMVSPGKARVTLRDGSVADYDQVLYGDSKPVWPFDVYTMTTTTGLETQRNFPVANLRLIEFGDELRLGRYRVQVFEVKVELLNGLVAKGWQYGARSFYLISDDLPQPTRQDLNTIVRIEFGR